MLPQNQSITYGTMVSYQLDAHDPSGIDCWWLDDSTSFHINQTGLLTSTDLLSVGKHFVYISVNDSYNNIQTAFIIITVIIVDSSPNYLLVGFLMVLISGLIIGTYYLRRRSIS